MKGSSKPLLKYMEGSDTRFIIPVYQRNYDWKKENCQQLLEDLVKVAKEDRPSHFFGSLVSSTEGSDNVIIDGQQRLTTISIMLLALTNLLNEGLIDSRKDKLGDKITNDYLIDQWDEEEKIKLKPVKNDQKAFTRLFGNPNDFVLESKVTQNYLYFYDHIKGLDITADELFDAIRKLIIIDISLEYGDNPQLIFESLNSTGLDLSEADKVRNYVLMGLSHAMQEKYYERYWNKIEEYTDYEVSEFIRQYLTFKSTRWPNKDKVYDAFKDYAQKQPDLESLLEDMLKYARIYNEIIEYSTSDSVSNRILERMGQLETSVVNPLLFSIIGRYEEGRISAEDMRAALLALESYLFRRLVCEVPTNSLNKTFATLANEADRLSQADDEFVPAMIYALRGKLGTTRFPNDAEFEAALRQRDFYNMRQKNRIYVFDRLENGDTYEKVNVPKMMLERDHGLSVEHIMPQTITEAWKKDLGEDWESVHEQWRDRIANLTLTGYNSKYSNRPFSEKLTIENGFKESPLFLNKWVGEQSHWGEAELIARENMLAERFLDLWVLPETEFEPAVDEDVIHSLDDDFDFTGTTIAAYTFMGSKSHVKTWKDAVEEILRQLYELDPATIRSMAASDDFPGNYLCNGKVNERGWFEIGNECYAYLATSTSSKMNLLMAVFDRIGLSGEDLIFEIRSDDAEEE